MTTKSVKNQRLAQKSCINPAYGRRNCCTGSRCTGGLPMSSLSTMSFCDEVPILERVEVLDRIAFDRRLRWKLYPIVVRERLISEIADIRLIYHSVKGPTINRMIVLHRYALDPRSTASDFRPAPKLVGITPIPSAHRFIFARRYHLAVF